MTIFRKIASITLSICFAAQQVCSAQIARPAALPGHLQQVLSVEHFRPMHVRYIGVNEHSNEWEVLLDRGDTAAGDVQAEETIGKLMEYFQIGLSLPNSTFWVNLRPDHADEMIDPLLEKTDLGKVLLEADLQLKKDLSRMTDPATEQGKRYWQKLYAKAEELYGQEENAEIPTYTRPWIVPAEIILGESSRGVYIYKATLKVMLESDYIENAPVSGDARARQLNDYSSQLLKDEIIPHLTRQVNSSRRYADLRQVYYSLILAQRYKSRPGELVQPIDTKDLSGLESQAGWDKLTYFNAYQQSFRQGEYSREEAVASGRGIIIRNYRSGGLKMFIADAQGSPGQVEIVPGSLRSLDVLKEKKDYLITQLQVPKKGVGQRDGGYAEKLRKLRDDLKNPKRDSQAVYNLKNFMRELLREDNVARDPEAADVLMEITYLSYGAEPFKDRERADEKFMFYLVQSVGKLGSTGRAFDFLRSAFLETKDDKELDAPVWALGFAGSAEAARLLIDNFADLKASAFLSKRKSVLEALRSLARAGVFRNDALLRRSVRDIAQGVVEREPKKWVCEEAVRLLGDLGDEGAKPLLLGSIAEYGDIALESLDKLGVTSEELAAAFTGEYAKLKHDYYRSLFIGQVFRYSREFNAQQLKDLARVLDVPVVQLERYRYFEDAARLVESVVKEQDVFSGDKSWYVLKAEEQLATGVAEKTVRSAIAGYIAQDQQYRAFFPTQGLEIELWRNNGTVALNKNSAKVFLERWGIATPHDDVLAKSPEGIIEYALGPMSRWERQRDMIEALRRLELLPAGTFPVHVNIGIQRFDEEYNKIFYLGDEGALKETVLQYLVYPLVLAYMPDSRIENTYQIGNDFKQAIQIHKRISPNSYLLSTEGEKESDRFEMRPFTLDTTKEEDTQLYGALEASQYVGVLINAKAADHYSDALADKDPRRIWFSDAELKRVEQIWDTMARRLDGIYQEHRIADIVVAAEPKDGARSRLKRTRQEENGKLRQEIAAVIRDAVAETRGLLGQKLADRIAAAEQEVNDGGLKICPQLVEELRRRAGVDSYEVVDITKDDAGQAVVGALRQGKGVAISVRGFSRESAFYPAARSRLFEMAKELGEAFDPSARIEGAITRLAWATNEVLQNGFAHGNGAQAHLPLFLAVVRDNQTFRSLIVVDNAVSDADELAAAQGFRGQGMGIRGIKTFMDYTADKIEADGRRVGTAVTISNLRDGGSVGGIDFRVLPLSVSTRAQVEIARLVKDIPAQTIAIDQEWLAIRGAVSKAKPLPVEQLKRYVAACCRNGSIDRQKETLLVCLADMLRVEEQMDLATDPFVKDLLSACQSLNLP